jgi:hypothetical protein
MFIAPRKFTAIFVIGSASRPVDLKTRLIEVHAAAPPDEWSWFIGDKVVAGMPN